MSEINDTEGAWTGAAQGYAGCDLVGRAYGYATGPFGWGGIPQKAPLRTEIFFSGARPHFKGTVPPSDCQGTGPAYHRLHARHAPPPSMPHDRRDLHSQIPGAQHELPGMAFVKGIWLRGPDGRWNGARPSRLLRR